MSATTCALLIDLRSLISRAENGQFGVVVRRDSMELELVEPPEIMKPLARVEGIPPVLILQFNHSPWRIVVNRAGGIHAETVVIPDSTRFYVFPFRFGSDESLTLTVEPA